MRATLRSDRMAGEREALRDLWSQRSLLDVAVEAMHRGDEVVIRLVTGRIVRGPIVDAGRDYAVVEAAGQRIAVRLATLGAHGEVGRYDGPPVHLEIPAHASRGGTKASGRNPTFAALLGAYDEEQQAAPHRVIEVGTSLRSDPLRGRIRARAWDHLYLHDLQDSEIFVALSTISHVTWVEDLGK